MSTEIEIPRLTILKQIGSGGMAVVYLARQEGLGREVAVKVLKQSLTSDNEEFRRRFEYEGQMLAELEHENIVKIYDIGSTDTAIYMVMEYLRGGTLTQRMQAGGLGLQDIIKVCAQIGLALHVAHSKNIIHRDLKPSNIMFRDPVTPVLTDFGIARKIDMDMTLTATGMMIGTPQYMSPEQIQGKPVDARSDIYSLGLMFYRLLTGELPFNATDPIAIAMQHIREDPPPLPQELSELQPVLDLMLAKDPVDRYQSTLDFCNHLRSISLTGEEYSTQLSNATRIFTSASFRDSASTPSAQVPAVEPGEPSSVSRAISSISTAVSAVFTRKKNRYVALASLAALVLAVFVVMRLTSPGLSESQLKRIELELRNFNAQVARMDIFEPAGANATETLRSMQEFAPDFGAVEDAANELADIYEGYAHKSLTEDDLDGANDLIQRGLALVPGHKGLSELGESVSARIAERDRRLRIDGLLAAGSAALENNRLLPPAEGNAYEVYREVRELDLQNAQAEAGLSEIQRRVTGQAREAWENGDREAAKQLALEGLEYFAESSMLLDLQAEIEREEVLEREQQDLERLLAEAEQQFAAGQLVEPPGLNAMDSYRRALELRPDEPAARAGLERIAEHYLEIAREQFRLDEFEASLIAADTGLRAVPDDPELLLAQNNATARLDARDRELQTRLQQAQRLASSGQLIPGQPDMAEGADSAIDAFNRVLEMDPGNQQAMEGLDRLPGQLDGAILAYERQGMPEKAKALLLAAVEVYPDNASGYRERIQSIEQLIAERAADLEMQGRLAAIDDLLAQRPVTKELITTIADSLLQVGGEDRYQVEVSDRLGRFISMIGAEAEQISRGGDDAGALALLDHGLVYYPGNTSIEEAVAGVRQRQADRAEQERLRIAALSGVLAIDATPWARVLEVRNGARELQDLPEYSETPLSLTLPEGEYTVVLAAADGNERYEIPARVTRQQVRTVRPDADQMTAQEYFDKSGW